MAQLDPVCLPLERAEGAGAVIAMTLPDDESNAEDPWWKTVRLWESPYKVIGQTPGIQFDTYFYHVDHLGTPRLITDISGNVVTYHKYDPFGEEFQPLLSPNTHQFTGHERDLETGLDYMSARYYDAYLHRFTAVDPLLTIRRNTYHPSRWNRYSYALNNPILYVDPDGRDITIRGGAMRTIVKEAYRRSATFRQQFDKAKDDPNVKITLQLRQKTSASREGIGELSIGTTAVDGTVTGRTVSGPVWVETAGEGVAKGAEIAGHELKHVNNLADKAHPNPPSEQEIGEPSADAIQVKIRSEMDKENTADDVSEAEAGKALEGTMPAKKVKKE